MPRRDLVLLDVRKALPLRTRRVRGSVLSARAQATAVALLQRATHLGLHPIAEHPAAAAARAPIRSAQGEISSAGVRRAEGLGGACGSGGGACRLSSCGRCCPRA